MRKDEAKSRETISRKKSFLSRRNQFFFLLLLIDFFYGTQLLNGINDDDNSNETLKADTQLIDEELIACQLALQKNHMKKVDYWMGENLPILTDVIEVGEFYHVIFFIGIIPSFITWNWRLTPKWKCNGDQEDAALVSSARKARTVVVRCKADSPLNVLTLSMSSGIKHSYNTTSFQICNKLRSRQDEQLFKDYSQMQVVQTQHKPQPRVGMCTSIRGNNIRRVVDQWVIYHRLIGVEHFFVYVNEKWNNLTLLPQRPYITYIPFDYCLANHKETLLKNNRSDMMHPNYWQAYPIFQELVNTHCLHRSKQLNYSWIMTTDVDEYVHIMDNSSSTLPQFLGKNFARNNTRDYLVMKLKNYGKNRRREQGGHKLLIDYIWKHKDKFDHRVKLVVNPIKVNYLDVHTVKDIGAHNSTTLDPSSQVYVNHYKNPAGGVHMAGRPKDWIKDDSLKEAYHEEVISQLFVKPTGGYVYSNNYSRV